MSQRPECREDKKGKISRHLIGGITNHQYDEMIKKGPV
jgi:hypothetical protein